MSTIITRAGKGSPLTNSEVDQNFTNLNNDKLEASDLSAYLSANDYDTATNIVASITDSAPATLDTLNELAAALGDDPNFAATVTNSIATKVAKSGDTMTGSLLMDGAIVRSNTNDVSATGATTTVDMASSNFHIVTMSASTTFSLSNLASSIASSGVIVIKQDATGGRTFTLPSVCKTPVNGASIVQTTTANTTSILSYMVVSSTEVLVNYVGDFA